MIKSFFRRILVLTRRSNMMPLEVTIHSEDYDLVDNLLAGTFCASYDNGTSWVYGHTLLVTFMSAMVKEEFGQFVDIPQELV